MVDVAQRVAAEELQPGYRMTELGALPEQWQVAALRDVVTEAFGGGTPSTKHARYWNGSIPWTTSAYLDGVDFRVAPKSITEAGLRSSSSQLVPAGNLLVGTRVGVGKVAVTHIDVAISQDLTGLIIEPTRADPRYLAYALMDERAQVYFRGATRGTTIKGIPRDDLLRVPLPRPRSASSTPSPMCCRRSSGPGWQPRQ